MKSERRHELQQNLLADWLGRQIQAIKPYQNAILLGIAAVFVIAALYGWWSRQAGRTAAAAWNRVIEATLLSGPGEMNPTEFTSVQEQYPNTTAADCAAVVAGDLHLAYGCNLLFVNKATANQELRKAVENYSRVLENSRVASFRERATFGLARAAEAQGDLEKAMGYYEQIPRDWPQGAFVEASRRRLEDLKRPSTRAMYDRFAKFDPKPAFSDAPGTPGQRPAFDLENLPENGPVFQPATPFGPPPGGARPSPAATEEPTAPEANREPAGPASPPEPSPAATEPSSSSAAAPDRAEEPAAPSQPSAPREPGDEPPDATSGQPAASSATAPGDSSGPADGGPAMGDAAGPKP